MKAKKYFSLLLCIVTALSISMEYIPAQAENASAWDNTAICVHHLYHTEDCGYTEAAEGQPCTHTHNENCGYIEAAEEIPCDMACTDLDSDGVIDHVEGCAYQPAVEGRHCTHLHNESCGYVEATTGTPCTYAVNGCPYCVVSWEWIDGQQLLTESEGDWGLGLAGVSQAEPLSQETLAAFLPDEITATTDSGETVTLTLTWDLSNLPEEGTYEGEYTLTASLPDPYALTQDAEPLNVTLQLGSGETYSSLPSGTPNYSEHIVNGVSPNGTTIDLFDYWITGQTDADNSNGEGTTFINHGINSGHALLFGNGLGDYNNKNGAAWFGDWNVWTKDESPETGIVSNELGDDGYPVLNVDVSSAGQLGGRSGSESLAYLFDPDTYSDGKTSYEDVQGLLQVDSDGYYYYNSQTNYAVYYADTNSFTLYNLPGIIPGGNSPVGQFFPFNAATSDGGWFTYKNQQYQLMNGNFSNTATINHYFGLHMSTRFIQQNGGYTDESKHTAVTYEFSGDDDIWIFIDGILIADLGGIHDAASVTINFATGVITINGEVQAKKLGEYFGAGNTLADDTYHTLDFFYLERGNVDSNMNLKYNLVTIPESDLIKVDQLGNPVEGAQFTLYAANDTDRSNPIATGTTNKDGEFVFLDDKGIPITIQTLYSKYGTVGTGEDSDLVLVETFTPAGYRSVGEIGLYFYQGKSDEVLLLSNNIWDQGAYAMPKVTATAPNVIRSADNPKTQVILSGANAVENPLMFAVVYQKQTHEDGSFSWLPVSGDPLSGWTVWQDNTWSSVLAAAQASPYLFQLASSGAYQVEISNLPGDIKTYYHLCQNVNTAEYTIGYYYSTAPSLAQATAENTWRIDSDPDQTGSQYALERVFSMDLYVSNVKNYLLVQKVDEDGATINGATFSLYKADDVTVMNDGTVTVPDNTAAYDTLTTADVTGILNLEGGGIFPATQDTLPNGEYYLIETSAPTGYKRNGTAIHVIVDNTGVYADAGTTEDGVTVLRGVGSVLKSVVQFAVDDGVDTTLQGIKAALATGVTYENGSFKWSDADWTSGDVLHLQYANSNKLLDYGLYDDAAPTAGSIDDLTLTTEEGWSKLLIQQCYQHDNTVDVSLKSDLASLGYTDITSLFSGSVTVRVANEKTGNLKISKTVTGSNAPVGQEFTFTVTVTDGEAPVTGEYDTLSESNISSTILFDENGTATVKLKAGESLTILALPTGAAYTVTETSLPAGYTPSVSVRNDTNAQISGVQVTGNIQHNTTQGNAVELNYLNHFDNTSALTISKTVNGNMGDRDQAFKFQITLKDASGNILIGSYPYAGTSIDGVTAPNSGMLTLNNGTATFTLKHGQSITISGLPAGTQYVISEPEAEADGYTTSITVGTEKTQAGYEVNDTLPAMTVVPVTFENRRESPPPTGIQQNTQPWLLALGIAVASGTTCFLVHQIFREKRRKESRNSHDR